MTALDVATAAREAGEDRDVPLDVAILDYGVGNLHSIRKALERAGAAPRLVSDPRGLLDAPALVLPGVGAFGDAARALAPFRDALFERLDAGRPLLGVCLGMQLLFEESEESPGAKGLGYVRGRVARLRHPKLPQIGWNTLVHVEGDPLFQGLPDGAHVYYVNSFAPEPRESVTVATSTYGETFTAAVRKRNAWGVQFHPEKSGTAGLAMIRNFVSFAKESR
ncbi:MAG TPA: imidazole glycerol phosphate synthase subunit HisH [Candidatus Thermoplasmatota archaeon]|nr:imidazole glycerol phosphate synthase subunit HisH [Candidatus Thermoplasmatota archaeon]